MRTVPENRAEARGGHVADAPLEERFSLFQPVEQVVVLVSHLRQHADLGPPAPLHLRHVLHQRQENLQRLSPPGEQVVPLSCRQYSFRNERKTEKKTRDSLLDYYIYMCDIAPHNTSGVYKPKQSSNHDRRARRAKR